MGGKTAEPTLPRGQPHSFHRCCAYVQHVTMFQKTRARPNPSLFWRSPHGSWSGPCTLQASVASAMPTVLGWLHTCFTHLHTYFSRQDALKQSTRHPCCHQLRLLGGLHLGAFFLRRKKCCQKLGARSRTNVCGNRVARLDPFDTILSRRSLGFVAQAFSLWCGFRFRCPNRWEGG